MSAAVDLQSEALRRVESWLARDRVRREREGALCRYSWNETGDLVGIVEADGSESSYAYDGLRRLSAVRHADGTSTRYRYGDHDRLVEIDSSCGKRRFEHDAAGRLAVIHRGDAGGVVYRYDAEGRVAEYRTALVSTRQRSDRWGRVTAICQTLNGVAIEMRLAYDAASRLRELCLPGGTIRYEWDAKGRPAQVSFEDRMVARFEYDDAEKTCRAFLANGVVEESVADRIDSRPLARRWTRNGEVLERLEYAYDPAGKILGDGEREYRYDDLGRLAAARCLDTGNEWCYRYDALDNRLDPSLPGDPREYRFDDAGQLIEVRVGGEVAARFTYDAKGRLAAMEAGGRVERYLYGPADGLFAVTDGEGRALRLYLCTPFGCLAEIDGGAIRFLHQDERGTGLFVTDGSGRTVARQRCDPFGLPLSDGAMNKNFAPWFGGRIGNPAVRLYYFGSRWYDPALGRFLTPDAYTAAPDDARIVHALASSKAQALVRGQLLQDWLRRPRTRNRYAFCGNDPVNCVDPNGNWSFGRELLTLLGAIWTLPNTIFGLLLEITCMIGEVIRWIVYVVSLFNVNLDWATLGFDEADSERLNAFALVFRGGWLGSFPSLLGITFGNVFFVYENWKESFAPGGEVSPPAYGGTVTFPRHDSLYEHLLRHTNQYGWFGPFFHLGLPRFGVYEWDVILHGHRDSLLEKDARDHGGDEELPVPTPVVKRGGQPILLVPGILASRLRGPEDFLFGKRWDPDGINAMLRLQARPVEERMFHLSAYGDDKQLLPPTDIFYYNKSLSAEECGRGYGGVAWKFYEKLLRQLEQSSQAIGGVVYAFGYDFRHSNWTTGRLLKERISQIRAMHNNRKVLIVTHSMGGLVARAACKQGAEEDVLGVVHVLQPANGTPVAYRMFKLGGKHPDPGLDTGQHSWGDWVADIVLGSIMGRTPRDYAAVASGFLSVFELLPNNFHIAPRSADPNDPDKWYRPPGNVVGRPWLTWDPGLNLGVTSENNIYDIYLERTGVTGLIDYGAYESENPLVYRRVVHGVEQARRFHEELLKGYVHPNTSVIAGDGLTTDVGVHIALAQGKAVPEMIRNRRGDATVSVTSAISLPLNGRPELTIEDFNRQLFYPDVVHATAFESDDFNKAVWSMCEQVLRCAAPLERAASPALAVAGSIS